ncbi:beta-propeller domain-containing protein [Clostridium lacusfryxellense]|uniref:beta-propeller domain-containing protein n=1 Tax=Clostridium lacusfryxellense TaxID=205328 RepID=UPI001C0A9EF2|nr:beta-propeller domain-containing protein [Clostridium lacusfryxellense]MBU3111238.1 beta-propeller domain-containing protein [Clostridium lacusfryxellense]
MNKDNINKDSMDQLKKEYDNIEVPTEIDLAIEKGIKKGKVYKRKHMVKVFGAVAAGLVLAVGITSSVRIISVNKSQLIVKNSSSTLPVVGTSKNLEKLLKTYIGQNSGIKNEMTSDDSVESMPENGVTTKSEASNSVGKSTSSNSIADHSTTNLQVEGVDEEDLVKTDGEYIFKVNAQKIINVIKTGTYSKMDSIKDITFEENYNISGIFLKGNTLVVVGNSYQNVDNGKVNPADTEQSKSSYMMVSNEVTKVISFDISDKKNIKKVRDIEVDGVYSSARMIGPRVYIVANKYLNNIGNIKNDENAGKAYYSDTAVSKEKIAIDYKRINYLPDSIQPNYIMVASYNVDDNKEKVSINTILGSGNNIYSSDKNLYIAGSKLNRDKNNNGSTNTILYKFAYEEKGVKFVSKGEVPGTITNQFSMDEHNGNFRIATTQYNNSAVRPLVDGKVTIQSEKPSTSVSNKSQNQMSNNLYILGKDMKVVGKIQGMASGEQIYSVRFIGDRAYMVTFMLTDPLFVIDLKNPTSPKILGELKIPGFSNYLHPYDDTHLIGFGMDTTVINEGGEDRAKTKGLKIAIFDVSNVSKPVQQFATTIGGAGTYSEVLNNHKALLFSKEKKLLALPVTENNYDDNTNNSGLGYQGAYIYNIDLVNGIKLKGKITHIDEEKNSSKNNSEVTNDSIYKVSNGRYFVDRILYIKDTIYTLSNGLIKASDINSLKEQSKLKLRTVDLPKVYPADGVREVTP